MKQAPSPSRPGLGPRLGGFALFAGCLAVLLFAGLLDSPTQASAKLDVGSQPIGLGSFGYPGCGFKRVTSLPCASCGMTSSFAYMADGQVLRAVWTQPAGAVLSIGTAMLALIGAWSLMTAMPLTPLFAAIFRPRNVIVALGLVLLAWVFNIVRNLGA